LAFANPLLESHQGVNLAFAQFEATTGLGLEVSPGLFLVALGADAVEGEGSLEQRLGFELLRPRALEELLKGEGGSGILAAVEQVGSQQLGRGGAGLGVEIALHDAGEDLRIAVGALQLGGCLGADLGIVELNSLGRQSSDHAPRFFADTDETAR